MKPAKYKNYNESELRQAIDETRLALTPIPVIARHFSIPRSTLYAKLKRLPARRPQTKSRTFLEFEEASLERRILREAAKGFAMTFTEIKSCVQSMLDRRGKSFESDWWLRRWLTKNKKLKRYKVKALDNMRTEGSDWKKMNDYHDEINKVVTGEGIDPLDIYNFDEVGFQFGAADRSVVYGSPEGIHYANCPGNYDSATVVVAVCADGTYLPPTVVFRGEHLLTSWFEIEELPDEFLLCASAEDWTDNNLAIAFLEHFIKYAIPKKRGEKILLVCDNHESHCTDEFKALCEENSIIPMYMPAHSSHINQPLDVACFGPLKRAYRKYINESLTRRKKRIDKREFILGFITALRVLSESNIKSGFRACGLVPLDRSVVLSKCVNVLQDESPDNEEGATLFYRNCQDQIRQGNDSLVIHHIAERIQDIHRNSRTPTEQEKNEIIDVLRDVAVNMTDMYVELRETIAQEQS